MASITTRLTTLLNIRTPVISASMAGVSGGALVAQVTLAGGFGFMAGFDESFLKELEVVRATLNIAAHEPLPVGVGYIGWWVDQTNTELLTVALENRVAAIWLSFGNNLGRYVDFVRRHDEARTEPHKTLIFVLVNSVDEARVAIEQWNADVLIAQGIEAGGHGSASAPPLVALIPEILRAFPHGPPIVAAGGLATGAQVAALLTLGAAGVALGTRFLLTPESLYSPAKKAALRAAHGAATVRTMAFDHVLGTLGWPAGVDGRGLRNRIVADFDAGLGDADIKKNVEAAGKDDADGLIVWAGTGVGLVNEIKGAGDVVRELHSDAVDHLRVASALLGNSSTK